MQHVLFIQGAGSEGAHEEDRALADSLQAHLGREYKVCYPLMPNEADPDLGEWAKAIDVELKRIGFPAFLVGHSIGASVLAKILSSPNAIETSCVGLFMISGPFWHDDAFWRWDQCALSSDAGERFPKGFPIYLYHGEDDAFVPVSHASMYTKVIPQAVLRELPGRDHQLNENLSEVARDIEEVGAKLLAGQPRGLGPAEQGSGRR
jgi:predicted alpha/beta hydrolase family esterase